MKMYNIHDNKNLTATTITTENGHALLRGVILSLKLKRLKYQSNQCIPFDIKKNANKMGPYFGFFN